MDEQKKISLPEIIIMVIFSLLSELLDIIVLGWVIGIPLYFWIIMKGGISFRKQAAFLAGNAAELIPLLNWLPMRTVTLIITIYLINHPETAGMAAPIKQ